MYSKVIEQELYGERWDKVKSLFHKGGVFSKSPLSGAASAGVADGAKAAKKVKGVLSNLFKSKEQKAKEEKERSDNALRTQRAKNRNYTDDLDKMKSEREMHMSIIKKKRSGQKLTPAEEKKYQNIRRRINERKRVREKSQNEIASNANEVNKYQEQVLRKSNAEKDRKRIALRKSAFRDSEAKRLRNYKIGGSVAGAGVGGALGYALSKRATRNTEPGKKRTAIRVGSTIAGAALGGVGGHYAGKKLALRGARLRYRNFQR
jgi:hypothetical protein